MLGKIFGKPVNNVINQLRMTVAVLSLFAVFNVVVIYRQIDSMTSDGRIVNYAGIVRGKTQRLTKLVLSGKRENDIITELDQIINGLMNGDTELRLVAVNDPEFKSKMEQLKKAWGQLKITLRAYMDDPSAEQRARLFQTSENYWELTNKAVFSAEAATKHHVEDSKRIAIALFVTNLILLGIILKISQNIRANLKNTITSLTTSSTEISATVAEQERIATLQATSVNETTTTMDELEASSRHASEQANAAAEVAKQAYKLAEGGAQAVEESLEGMFILEQKVDAIAEQIINLSSQAGQIGSISQLVADFANQTNMLALNSSVEAVRAGEHGKGFAVVANEIRRLADQSQQSAEKINNLVSEIQKAINSTVMVTDEGTKTVKAGVQIAQRTEQAFAGVKESVNQVALNNQQVSLNLKQQVDAIRQVVEAMETVNRGSRETATGLSQTRAGTEQLNHAAIVLQKMV